MPERARTRSSRPTLATTDPLADSLWNASQVAEKLGISEFVVGEMARRNEIPSIKIGKFRRYQPAAIRSHIDRLTP